MSAPHYPLPPAVEARIRAEHRALVERWALVAERLVLAAVAVVAYLIASGRI